MANLRVEESRKLMSPSSDLSFEELESSHHKLLGASEYQTVGSSVFSPPSPLLSQQLYSFTYYGCLREAGLFR